MGPNGDDATIPFVGATPAREIKAQPEKRESEKSKAKSSTGGKKVLLKNPSRADIPVVLFDERGKQQMYRVPAKGSFGPIEVSRLTPQIESLRLNKRLRIQDVP